MKIIVDGFGGDHAPLEILRGTAEAIAEYGIEAAVCGDIAVLKSLAQAQDIPVDGMEFVQAGSVMPVEAEPTSLLKQYGDSSMAVGLKLLAEGGGDAFVTAGSTGAAVVGASLIVKRIKGVKRPALAPIIPDSKRCHMMLDIGANTECRPEMLAQFAVMGTAYMRAFMELEKPRVGLVNIGAEPNKGTDLQTAAYKLLQKAPVNFIGNVEARDLPLGACDIALTDGFTGNIILKHTEGMAKFFSLELKEILLGSATSKLAALILKKQVQAFRKKLDYTEYGGTPLMGIRKPVIKAHGSSNDKAFKNAIRQARQMCVSDVISQIEMAMKGVQADD
jgi:glycerol-3-phosphate acyltransferase PlsX